MHIFFSHWPARGRPWVPVRAVHGGRPFSSARTGTGIPSILNYMQVIHPGSPKPDPSSATKGRTSIFATCFNIKPCRNLEAASGKPSQ